YERATRQPLHTVLRYRTEHPELQAPEIAEQLAGRLGKAITSAWVRKRLYLAREKFRELLLEEVAQTLHRPTTEELELELLELGLLDYCRIALQRRAGL